jgi:hypothetical protein
VELSSGSGESVPGIIAPSFAVVLQMVLQRRAGLTGGAWYRCGMLSVATA